ncbi:MAG: hypothetical protein RI894_986, partial [Bacteroidota bacterium]
MFFKKPYLYWFAGILGLQIVSFVASAQEQHVFIKDMQSNPVMALCTLTVKKGKTVSTFYTNNGTLSVNFEERKRYDIIVNAKGYKRQSIAQKFYDGVIITLPIDPSYIDTVALASKAREEGRQDAIRAYQPLLQTAQEEARKKGEALKISEKRVAVLKDSVAQQAQQIRNLGGEVATLKVQQSQTTAELVSLKTAVAEIKENQAKRFSLFSFILGKKKGG